MTPSGLPRAQFDREDQFLGGYWSFHNLGDVTAFKKGPNQGRAFRHSL